MDVNEVLAKYSKKIEREIGSSESNPREALTSKDYMQFKEDMMPELSRYEKWASSLGGFIKINLAKKDKDKVQKQLDIAHLDISPGDVAGLAVVGFLGIFFISVVLSIALWMIYGGFPLMDGFPFLFFFLSIIIGFFFFYYFYSMPSRLAVKWRLKASSQMVPAVLYTVIYMKHTSNLERAISFVSQHIEPPLSLDLKKVLWNVETGKYSTIKESLDAYLDFWKDTNMEFVESFHLIESSLYEPSDARRIQILERALKVILDGVYESMLKYTHSIKSPLTNLYMLGIVLPTLGLALLPLASTLMGGVIKGVHVFLLFNLLIPFVVFYLTLQIMLRRPGGYGESSLLKKNPLYYQYESRKPYLIAFLICFPFLLLGFAPLIIGYTPIPEWVGLVEAGQIYDPPLSQFGLGFFGKGNLFGFLIVDGGLRGPFGVVSLLLSLLIPFSIAMFFSLSYSMKTKELIKSRESTRALEKEFNNSLFTLGNRLGDGTPAEIAFSKVLESTRGQKTEDFFKIVNTNLRSMGMSLEDAIFNPKRGALIYYPSSLIATSMRILIESAKKGLKVAAQSLMSISEYVRNLHKINERLRDLLAEVVSDMKSNMTFLAPLLAGIVVGLASMITGILGQLENMIGGLSEGGGGLIGMESFGSLLTLFELENMIPPYYLQIAIGIYITQIIFILTATLVTIDSGEDKLRQTYVIAKNLILGSVLYLITALIAILSLSLLANIALGSMV